MKKSFVFFFVFCVVLFIIATSGLGCANIIPPSGGPRDSVPPVLVSAAPKDSTLNFKGNRIVLNFDEFIDLQDVQQNLLFTPTFENVPVIEAKLKTLTIKLRDSLERNTTYTFNFGNAIKDINEGNTLHNFTYVFSTGSYLDSLQLQGNVVLADNGKIDSTLTVVLHTQLNDSAVVKQRPRYATRLDSAGNFVFKNLPRDTFAIYAIGDAGTLRRYTSPNQYFAFADSPVISGRAAPITLYAYKEEEKQIKPVPRPAAPADKRLRFTTNLSGNQQELLNDLVLNFEQPLRLFDSTKIRLTVDSLFTPVTKFSTTLDSTKKTVRIQTAWKEAALYRVLLDKDFAEDTLGHKLIRTDTIKFATKKLKDYGSIRIRIRNIDAAQHPVLQFVQSDKVVFSTPISSGNFASNLFMPGEYELRILYDRNQNGVWDPGQFFGTRRQPEIVRPIAQKISIKPDWENEFERGL